MATVIRKKIVIFWFAVQFLCSAMTMDIKGMYWIELFQQNKNLATMRLHREQHSLMLTATVSFYEKAQISTFNRMEKLHAINR